MYYDEAEEVYYGYDLSTDKGYDNFVKRLVLMARNTPEYKRWSKDCKVRADEKMEFECPFCGVEYEFSRIESHHYPKTLYEIFDYEVQKYIQSGTLNEDYITPLEIVKNVMDLHKDNKVEYVNLCKGCHERFHAMDEKIRQQVYEYWKEKKEENAGKEEK